MSTHLNSDRKLAVLKTQDPAPGLARVKLTADGVADTPSLEKPVNVRSSRHLNKGQQTKSAIIEAALKLATHVGLEGLSIGAVAELTGMSKSGVFAHFGSREELQISVVHEYHRQFEQEVFFPCLELPRGIARLRALFDHWMKRSSMELDTGCIYISGAVEFDDRSGPVRDALTTSVHTWHAAMRRTIVQSRECGDLCADLDENQFLFEAHGLILVLHYEARFLRSEGALERAHKGFDNLLGRYCTSAAQG